MNWQGQNRIKELLYGVTMREEAGFTFADLAGMTNKTANYFKSLGIGKGDPVMAILKEQI